MTPPDAGAAERDTAERLSALGATLVLRLTALMRTARTYDVSNQAFRRQMEELLALLQRAHEDDEEIAIVSVGDYLYLNGSRIRAEMRLMGPYHALMSDFERRRVGGLRFLPGVSEPEIERFFQVFLAAEDPALADHLPDAVAEAAIRGIACVPTSELEVDDLGTELEDAPVHQAERTRAKRTFWRAMAGARKIVLRARHGGRPDLRHAKRVVQPIVDNIMKHEYSIVGLTALKDHDEYTYAHCVNVAILSVGMGQTLGLPRQALADLGVAGLLHDLGKMAIPGEVLRKPGALTSEEWTLMRRHPLDGAMMIARMPGLSTVMLDAMRACLEHHLNYNRTGYPDVDLEWGQATMSRIVAMADCFDAITAHRAYARRPFTPFEGLQILLGPNRVNFDPAVLWALVKTVGLYPAGTVLQTSTGHVVLAVSPNPADGTRPHCRVLLHPDGSAAPEEPAQAWDPMPAGERVMRVLLPEDVQVSTTRLLGSA